MMKKIALIVVIALIHFGLSVLIVATANSVATATNPVTAEPTFGFRTIVVVTKFLHFPIISLALYPRQWFPGNWIYIPILVNSFIWAAGIYVMIMLGKKIKEKKRNGK